MNSAQSANPVSTTTMMVLWPGAGLGGTSGGKGMKGYGFTCCPTKVSTTNFSSASRGCQGGGVVVVVCWCVGEAVSRDTHARRVHRQRQVSERALCTRRAGNKHKLRLPPIPRSVVLSHRRHCTPRHAPRQGSVLRKWKRATHSLTGTGQLHAHHWCHSRSVRTSYLYTTDGREWFFLTAAAGAG